MPIPEYPNWSFKFGQRRRDELLCHAPEGSLVLEITQQVFLPTEEIWQRQAPSWAKGYWSIIHADLTAWCATEGIPLKVSETAEVSPCS